MEKKYLSEWKRAKSFLVAAKNNLKLNDIKTVANREYFATERAVVTALILENKKAPKNHKKIWEVSKALELNMDITSFMRKLYDLRLQGDYGKTSEIIKLNKETVVDNLKEIETLIEKIKKKYKLK